MEFVDGSIEKPLFNQCNNMVLSWLIRSLSPSFAQTATNFNSAESLWKEGFSQSDIYRLADLQGEIYGISQGTRSVTEYFAVLQNLWDEYSELSPMPVCACDGCACNTGGAIRKAFEVNQVICLLRGLNRAFQNVKSQTTDIYKVFSLVLQFESRFSNEDKELDLVGVTAGFVQRGRFDKGGSSQQMSTNSFVDKGGFKKPGNKGNCSYCKGNHLVNNCWKKNGIPPHIQQKFVRANLAIEDYPDQDDYYQGNWDKSDVQQTPAQLQQHRRMFQSLESKAVSSSTQNAFPATASCVPVLTQTDHIVAPSTSTSESLLDSQVISSLWLGWSREFYRTRS